jgi:hypothetical protein
MRIELIDKDGFSSWVHLKPKWSRTILTDDSAIDESKLSSFVFGSK